MTKKKTTESQSVAEQLLGLAERKEEKVCFTVRMNGNLKERMENAAADNGVSINAYINTLVAADLRKNGYL